MRLITSELTTRIVAEVCDLLNKNGVSYLVYGSVGVKLLMEEDLQVNDIDIIVMESDFEQLKQLLRKSFNPIWTGFSIHANSTEYLGYDGKPFDISFDSYGHYFAKLGVDFSANVDKDVNGVTIKIMPQETLHKIYEKFSSKYRGR